MKGVISKVLSSFPKFCHLFALTASLSFFFLEISDGEAVMFIFELLCTVKNIPDLGVQTSSKLLKEAPI